MSDLAVSTKVAVPVARQKRGRENLTDKQPQQPKQPKQREQFHDSTSSSTTRAELKAKDMERKLRAKNVLLNTEINAMRQEQHRGNDPVQTALSAEILRLRSKIALMRCPWNTLML
jgi:2,3-bisphosphoglycerate-independent phosphoglycerate mutase